jgi:polar amino acid transport system permease protein
MNAFVQNFFDLALLLESLPALFRTGLINTLTLSILSTALGTALGMALALCAVSRQKWLLVPTAVYIDIFRGLPAALVILIIGQGLAPVGLSLFGPNPYPLAVVALSLIASAYISEIFRSGIQSVGAGQMNACRALGMSYWASMRHVIVPQGVRRILPALANQFVSIIKDSSLVYFLGLLSSQRDLFTIGQNISVNSANLTPLVAAGLVYLVMTVPLTHAINYIDRRGHSRTVSKPKKDNAKAARESADGGAKSAV